jgi:leader peptidase (prepilin peptidase)/N-methyltransferase
MIFGAKILLYLLFATRLSLIDLRTFRLPHRLTLPLAGVGFLFSFIPGNGLSPWGSFLGFGAGIVPLGILAWKRQKTFGFGDAVFAGAIGSFSGVAGLGIALVASGLMALAFIKLRSSHGIFPFGPFLAMGGLLGSLLPFIIQKVGGIDGV